MRLEVVGIGRMKWLTCSSIVIIQVENIVFELVGLVQEKQNSWTRYSVNFSIQPASVFLFSQFQLYKTHKTQFRSLTKHLLVISLKSTKDTHIRRNSHILYHILRALQHCKILNFKGTVFPEFLIPLQVIYLYPF